jgi:aminoglycoside phosphotransferase (APT) family kinase protein
MGGMNYHVEIRFEDGVSWLARIRRSNATSPPPDLRDHIIRSEVATLQFLEKTGVPAPRVFDFDFERKENPVGVGYILMEKMPGKSLRWSLLSADQRKKVMSQLADIYITLHSFPFQSAGSFDQPGTSHIGSFARESLTDYHPSGEMRPLGPYSSHEQYLIATLRLTLSLIVRQECYTPRAVDAYLIHRYLLDCIPAILSQHTHDDGYFYLKHADEKGDHILIDSSLNITSIIDWEWAHTAPKSSAFKSPIVLLSVSDFYAGINTLGDDEAIFAQLLEEKGNPELAEIVKRGRILHRFEFCAGYDLADWDGFLGLFQGLRSALDSDAQLDWPAWREMAIRRYAHEEELRLLLEEDRGRG